MIKERQKYGWINCEKCKTLIQDVSMFEEVLKYINNGIITISVSGRFNAGKSSLINCLLQNMLDGILVSFKLKLLPVTLFSCMCIGFHVSKILIIVSRL